ncbi:MAG: hypothetical protein R3E89_03665 [Thiolinea sp.]
MDNFLFHYGAEFYGTPTVLIFDPQGKLSGIEVGALIAQDIIDFIEARETKTAVSAE